MLVYTLESRDEVKQHLDCQRQQFKLCKWPQSILAVDSKGGDDEMSEHKLSAESKPTHLKLMDSGTCIHMFLCQLLEALKHRCGADVNMKSY